MKNSNEKFSNMKKVGNFTKNAVESFENNIINQTNYLEKVKKEEEKSKDNHIYS